MALSASAPMLAASVHLEQIRPRYESGAPRLLEQVREVIRSKHYSLRTEDAYIDWVRRFVRFCELRHPRDCGSAELEAFLMHLAVHGRVSASTQKSGKERDPVPLQTGAARRTAVP
jgi:hypothetical protein